MSEMKPVTVERAREALEDMDDYARMDAGVDAKGPRFGMTLRDYFAAKVMQGLLANPGGPIQVNHRSGWGWCNCAVEDVADLAWHIADAMLKARENGND